uniref:Uncharacterized protein n=1 Tax=Rhizophora mucronata TaxID=61149 RepID=A0A2P2JVE1_RHIMU
MMRITHKEIVKWKMLFSDIRKETWPLSCSSCLLAEKLNLNNWKMDLVSF